jgi:hypothetical protein
MSIVCSCFFVPVVTTSQASPTLAGRKNFTVYSAEAAVALLAVEAAGAAAVVAAAGATAGAALLTASFSWASAATATNNIATTDTTRILFTVISLEKSGL